MALDGLDFKKHSGVISNFQMRYIKTGIFDKQLSNIIKSAFSLRTESDYEDFYVIAKADVKTQVKEADIFYHAISEYIMLTTLIISKKPGNTGISRDIRTEFTTDLLLSD